MNREIIDLYDRYTHSLLDRRTFLERLAALVGGAAAANAMLPLLENDYARAAMVPEDDTRIRAAFVEYPGAEGNMRGYLAHPADKAGETASVMKYPAVVVIHENRGLNPHIRDVVRRFAVAGYLALGPDALSATGGTPASEDEAREKIGKLDPVAARRDFEAAVAYVRTHPRSNGNVGCVGFCWGGAMVNQVAVHVQDLKAAVAFYGRVAALEDVPKIQAPLLLHYAGRDERINADVPAYRQALEDAGKEATVYMYPDVDHAFHNDTNAARYDEEAAKLAWDRTLAFLAEKLAR
jgi:carboxymethylenebutenolidase